MGWTFYNSSGQQLRNTGTVLATQAEMETGTALTSFVTPGRTQYHPGVAKAWVAWEQTGANSMYVSYNMTSVADGGAAGDTDLLWATDFSSVNYTIVGMLERDYFMGITAGTRAATGCTIINKSHSGAATDSEECMLVAFGDQ